MPAIARKGDPGSHGGVILDGSPTFGVNSRDVARVGDLYGCPEHGPNAIVSGSPDFYADGRKVARVGDPTACGAVITAGSPDTFVND